MEIEYNMDNIDSIDKNLSMGENALIYYDDILEKKVLNRIIISNILKLHKKGYVELDKNSANELVVKIKNGTEKLKITETFIYECLSSIDRNSDFVLTLDELNASENKVFAKNKYRIKELIIEEASADELIDVKKYKKKKQYFFRTIEVLLILIFSFLIPNTKFMLAILIISIAIIIQSRNFIAGAFFSNPKHAFKKKSFNDEMFKNCSKIEIQNIITEFFVCIIIYFLNFYLLENISLYINATYIFCIEIIITLIYAIIQYIKFRKTDIYTDKAILNKQKLKKLGEFLKNNSLIQDRRALEIYIWEDFLTFSVLLGINNNIPDEIKINLSNIENKSGIYYNYYDNRFRNS